MHRSITRWTKWRGEPRSLHLVSCPRIPVDNELPHAECSCCQCPEHPAREAGDGFLAQGDRREPSQRRRLTCILSPSRNNSPAPIAGHKPRSGVRNLGSALFPYRGIKIMSSAFLFPIPRPLPPLHTWRGGQGVRKFAEASLRTPETSPATLPIPVTARCYETAELALGAPRLSFHSSCQLSVLDFEFRLFLRRPFQGLDSRVMFSSRYLGFPSVTPG